MIAETILAALIFAGGMAIGAALMAAHSEREFRKVREEMERTTVALRAARHEQDEDLFGAILADLRARKHECARNLVVILARRIRPLDFD